jgi:hypothetical protein
MKRFASELPASIIGLLLVAFGLFPLAAPATAGQGAAAPAGIVGQVTDGTGAVLPGVTVTATSPALQVPSVTAVTDEQGDYRLTPLPIGTYTVVYELPGFQNLRREGVRLTVGFVARVDQVMNLGAVSETITVSGASPLVDTTSTATRTELTQEQLDVLPTTRDGLKAFLGQVPGARSNLEVGMSGLSDGVVWRIYGQQDDQWHMIEGVLGTTGGAHFDFNSIDGTRVQTVGSNAEMPRRGMLVDSVIKSGGNDFHGDATFYGTNSRFEADNVDDNLRRQGIRGTAKLHHQVDLSGGIGGRLIRNKLWFFGAGSIKSYDREVLDAINEDGTPIVLTTDMFYHVEKISYQMTPANRLMGFYHKAQDSQVRDASRFLPAESRIKAYNPVDVGKVEWQGVRGSSMVTSVQHGFFDYAAIYDSPSPGRIATTDIATLYVTGAHVNDGKRNYEFRHHTKAVVSWYKSDLFAGNHEFKGGVDHLFSWRSERTLSRESGDYQLQFDNGAPYRIATWNTPVTPRNDQRYVGLYVQDAWTIARRLTLNLGIRYGHDNAYAPAQCREAGDFAAAQCWEEVQMNVWDSFAPRIHAAYDLFGNGRTVIKGGWGRFDRLRGDLRQDLMPTNRNNAQTTNWTWHDLNGNRAYESGEVNLDPNGPDFQGLSGSTDAVPNPNEKQGKTDEFSMTLERELVANWALRATGIYSRNFNQTRLLELNRPPEVYNIPITSPDPGPDGRVGTSDDPGTTLTYYDYPARLRGRAFAGTMLINDPAADQDFKTIEVAGIKRLSQGWQLFAAYSATKLNLPFTCNNSRGPNGEAARCAMNPNAEIFASNNTWEWSGKLSGAYTFPLAISASANYEVRSGTPQARRVLLRGGQAITSLLVNAEPVGSITLPNTHVVDLRAAKRFGLGGSKTMELRMDVFNAFNANTTLQRVLQSGPEYLKTGVPFVGGLQLSVVQATLLPRIAQFAAAFTF